MNKLSTVALGYHDVQYCIVVKTLNVACQGGGLGAIRAKPMHTEDDADRLLLAALRVFYLFLCSIKFQGILKLEKFK
ncbi:hypothetical protein OOU_Y34scaffold00142g4 [Pyricularia oryzae Y34]|uniref:Uncharacterized protein n=2 Tax=Pyricularia oryzae TaxID=318829 RepID=A0AA97PQU1_PYRO3|nr:hypothetical protein OOU_Y34scaffold00142g4 [Pyricularia oryzae Y34]